MAQTPGAAYRNYNRIQGNTNDTKYVCYGPAGTGSCYAGAFVGGNSSFFNMSSSGSYGYGTAIAAAIATSGSSASAAKADLAPTGTAASQLSVLRDGPVAQNPPAAISA